MPRVVLVMQRRLRYAENGFLTPLVSRAWTEGRTGKHDQNFSLLGALGMGFIQTDSDEEVLYLSMLVCIQHEWENMRFDKCSPYGTGSCSTSF